MPYYEYQCLKCQQNLEVLQKMSDPPKKKCPQCGGKLEKLISNTSFQLKGGGWYADGYASSTPAEAKTPEKKDPPKPAEKTTKKVAD